MSQLGKKNQGGSWGKKGHPPTTSTGCTTLIFFWIDAVKVFKKSLCLLLVLMKHLFVL